VPSTLGRRLAAFAAGSLACALCAAGPLEDHEAGVQALRQGDVTGAMVPLRRAAEANHAPAQALLASIFDNAGLTDEAVPLYRRAAAQGNADAQAALAGLHVEGRAVPPDLREAFRLYERAAASGHALAVQAVADAYLRNDTAMLDTDATDAKALAALRRAGEAGYVAAIVRLVDVYAKGQLGVSADAAEAERWQARLARVRPKTGARK